MTKTILILLVGGAAALASLVLGNGLSSTTATRPATLAWEQPPILAPRPGDQIIILKSVNDRPRGLIAWEQPPILAPRPGDQIIILKSREPVGNDRVAWEQPPILAPRPGDQIIILKGTERIPSATA